MVSFTIYVDGESVIMVVAMASMAPWAAMASAVEMALLAIEVHKVSEALLALEATEAPPATLLVTAQPDETALTVSSVLDVTD